MDAFPEPAERPEVYVDENGYTQQADWYDFVTSGEGWAAWHCKLCKTYAVAHKHAVSKEHWKKVWWHMDGRRLDVEQLQQNELCTFQYSPQKGSGKGKGGNGKGKGKYGKHPQQRRKRMAVGDHR